MSDKATTDSITAAVRGRLAASRPQGIPGKTQVFWQENERLAVERHPLFWPALPSTRDVRSLLWRSRALVATYVMQADDAHPANALLYLCENRDYNLEDLASPARRNVRRALRAFRFELIGPAVLLAHGARPFCDTRSRVGLSDGTVQLFQKHATP